MKTNKIFFEEEYDNLQQDVYQTEKALLKAIFRDYINELDEEKLKHQYAYFSLIALGTFVAFVMLGILSML